MWTQINQAWLDLDAREQNLVKALAVFLVLAALYVFIWAPIQSNKLQAQQQLESALQEWQWLNEQLPAVEAMRSSGGASNSVPVTSQNQLMALLQKTLREQNLFKDIKTLQGTAKGGKVSFEKVDATRLFKWLSLLEQQGVTTNSLQASWLETGLVKAEMQFTLQ